MENLEKSICKKWLIANGIHETFWRGIVIDGKTEISLDVKYFFRFTAYQRRSINSFSKNILHV